MGPKKLRIGFSVIAMLGATLLGGRLTEFVAAMTAAALHEFGHVAAARLLGIRLSGLTLDLLGARLDTGRRLISYGDELRLAAAGPFVNLICFIAAYPLTLTAPTPFVNTFTAASAGLCLLNLLPIESFDGGRILTCAISMLADPSHARRAVRVLSFFCIFTLWSGSVYLLLRTGSSLSLFVFSAALFARIFIAE